MMNQPQFPDILIWVIPLFIVGIAIELLWLRRRPVDNAYTFKDAVTSLVMGSGMSLTDVLFKSINLTLLMWIWVTFPHFDLGYTLPIILLALFVDDFTYYWKHWLYHKSRWFWASHVVHHSSEHYNLTTALRQPWSNYISGTVFLKIPLLMMGFHPILLAFVGGVNFCINSGFIQKRSTKLRVGLNIFSTRPVIIVCTTAVTRDISMIILPGFLSSGTVCLELSCRNLRMKHPTTGLSCL